jgi:L-asparagine oxygenase
MPTVCTAPLEYALTSDDVRGLELVVEALKPVAEVATATDDPADPAFYDRHWPATYRLPAGLGNFLGNFLGESRRTEPAAACLIKGFPVDDRAIGPTPRHWNLPDPASVLTAKLALALCGMVLGEPFTWLGQQANHMIMNIVPILGDELNQSGHSSESLLEFHTEDAYDPRRCDYLLLLGLRNHERVPTILASAHDLDLPAETREVLAQERFHILPDTERIRQLADYDPAHPALARLQRLAHQPPSVAVLSGDRINPHLRIDRRFMRCAAGDTAAEQALDDLMEALVRVQQDVVVEPGSLLIVDNHLAVHGRRPFHARYDGTDRWLKKLTVRRDLRRDLAERDLRGSHRILP